MTHCLYQMVVHKNEIEEEGIEIVSKKYEAIVNFIQTELKW